MRGPADAAWTQVMRGRDAASYAGEVWLKESLPSNPLDVQVDLANPNVIYICGVRPVAGIRRSTNGGTSWTKTYDRPCLGVWVDPSNPTRVYACMDGSPPAQGGLCLSEDHGATWTFVDSFPFNAPMSVDFDPRNPGVIYVGTWGGGTWKGSPVLGATAKARPTTTR